MPRYFIDTDDETVADHDDDGAELDGPQAARIAALEALPDMARDSIPKGDRQIFTAHFRDESGTVIYTATLTLRGEWTNAGSPL